MSQRVVGVVAPFVCGVLLAAGPIASAGAASGPDLAAFSGCVAAHSVVQGYDRGDAPTRATITLVASTLRGSRTAGAGKVARQVRRAKRPEKVEAAVRAAAAWCTASGVPPITLPPATTAPAP